jgi:hypothetical protein
MGKSHRDNARARRKRGAVAFAKKAKRRVAKVSCRLCGTRCRQLVLNAVGICPTCVGRLSLRDSAA